MDTNKTNILGVNIVKTSLLSAVEKVGEYLKEEGNHIVCTPNSEMIMLAKKDTQLKEVLNQANLTVADGAGVVIASKILGDPVPERVAGSDLVSMMFNSNSFKDVGFFLLGAHEDVVNKAATNLQADYNIKISGTHHGFFNEEDSDEIISIINNSAAQILLVGLGAPKQEKWILKNKSKLNVKVSIGIGGCFDVFSGNVKRAPEFFQVNHLEWLYRLYCEPSRFVRMLALPQFMAHVIYERFNPKKD